MPERIALIGSTVRLEPMERTHVDELLAAATLGRDTFGYTLVPDSRPEMETYVETALEDERVGWALPYTIRLASGGVVGSTRFMDLAYWADPKDAWQRSPVSVAGMSPSAAEIGSTWLSAPAQRTGVNTEAKLLLLTHAFETWKVERVSFKTDARNQRSRRAIERIGARFEGVRRAHLPALDATIRDSAYYSILRDEWTDVRDLLERQLGARPETKPQPGLGEHDDARPAFGG